MRSKGRENKAIFLVIPFLAVLTLTELQELSRYEALAVQNKTEAIEEARKAFSGRALDVAVHFLKHGDYPPSSSGYAFVLKALADAEATLFLIRALPDPPKYETGVTAKYGMGRELGEIQHVIETVLENEELAGSPRIIAALVDTVSVAKGSPQGLGLGAAARAVEILGKCQGPLAIEALQKFASDSDSSIRTLAVTALGRMGQGSQRVKEVPASTTLTLTRTLQSDPNDHARLQAAISLGNLGLSNAVEPLKLALSSEKNPQVVDAIVRALEGLRSPVTDPTQCLEILSRCWEPRACYPLFHRWRSSVGLDVILDAAESGPLLVRALTLHSLVERPRPQSLVSPFVNQPIPPPPVPGLSPGRQSMTLRPVPEPQPSSPVAFAPMTQDRLLKSAVETLSTEETALPKMGKEISYGTAQMTRDALWEISGRNMEVALDYADRITPALPFPRTSPRFVASQDLYRKDRDSYHSYRRPRQFLAALFLTLPLALFLIPRFTRLPALLLIFPILSWGVWSLFIAGTRELPPPPLRYLTAGFFAFIVAGTVTALSVVCRRWWNFSVIGSGAFAVAGSGILAFVFCGWSRWYGYFPIGGEGWELIFDPIISAVGATIIALPLFFLASFLSRDENPSQR